MGTVIGNNTGSNGIEYPDVWAPGFSLAGCVYAGLYDTPDLTVNLAPGGSAHPATQIGTTVRDGIFPRFKAGNFQLLTDISCGAGEFTIISLYHKLSALGQGSGNRVYAVSSYRNDTADRGASLILEGGTDNTVNPPNISSYRWAGATNGVVQASGSNSAAASGWSCSMAESWPTADATPAHARILNMLNGGTASNTGTGAFQSSTNKIAIGGRTDSTASGTQEVTMAACLMFNRRLSRAEINEIMAWLRKYLARRGIII